MWKVVDAKTRKIRMEKTKREREKGEERKETRNEEIEKERRKKEKEKNNRSKKAGRRVEDLEWERRSSKVRGDKMASTRKVPQVDLCLWQEG